MNDHQHAVKIMLGALHPYIPQDSLHYEQDALIRFFRNFVINDGHWHPVELALEHRHAQISFALTQMQAGDMATQYAPLRCEAKAYRALLLAMSKWDDLNRSDVRDGALLSIGANITEALMFLLARA